MDQWKPNDPEAKWVTEEKERHTLKPPADDADLLKGAQSKGDNPASESQPHPDRW